MKVIIFPKNSVLVSLSRGSSNNLVLLIVFPSQVDIGADLERQDISSKIILVELEVRGHHVASDGGHEAGEGELVGPALLYSEYPGVLVHPLGGDGAAAVENRIFSNVRASLVTGEGWRGPCREIKSLLSSLSLFVSHVIPGFSV